MSPRAERDLKALARKNRRDYERLATAIRDLAHDHKPPGSRKLVGRESYKIRIGNYRVIYRIDDKELVVTVLVANHRRDVYKQ